MKFDELAKSLESDGRIEVNADVLFKQQKLHPCCMCKELTQWADCSFMAFFCSEGCLSIMWDEYWSACNNNAGTEPEEFALLKDKEIK